jgi:hypothetical protein
LSALGVHPAIAQTYNDKNTTAGNLDLDTVWGLGHKPTSVEDASISET